MMIEVRPFEAHDADAVAEAHIEGWRVGYRHTVPDRILDAPEFRQRRIEGWRAEMWREYVDSECHVGVLDGEVVGFAHCGPEHAPADDAIRRGEVYGFYLHPRAWGSGVAAAMMVRCRERLAAMGFTTAVLYVVADNPRGRAFYTKDGWRHDPAGDGVFPFGDLEIPDTRYVTDISVRVE